MGGQSAVFNVEINDLMVEMVYDPGAVCTIFPLRLWRDLGKPVLPTVPTLQAYNHIPIATRGQVTVDARAFGQQKLLTAIVVDTDDVCLFGLDWCQAFDLNLPPRVTVRNLSAECFHANAQSRRRYSGPLRLYPLLKLTARYAFVANLN